MCSPKFFTVTYEINPWMDDQIKVDVDKAHEQWNTLRDIFAKYAQVEVLEGQPNVPDLVFTANAATIKNNIAVVARYKHSQRQLEEPFNIEWFKSKGYEVVQPPKDIAFEGTGDALYDRINGELWCGYGPRTDRAGLDFLEEKLNVKAHKLELVDPRFYHIDTAFCPLTGGYLLYFPGAFSSASQKEISEYFKDTDKVLEVSEEEAQLFCCNAVDLVDAVAMHKCPERVSNKLQDWGFKVHEVNLSEFLKAGGSAKCLSLRISE